MTSTTHNLWETGPTAFCQRGKRQCRWERRSKETPRSAAKGTAARRWRATTRAAGLWRRPGATATVVQFFLTVVRSLSLGLEHTCFRVEGNERLPKWVLHGTLGHHHAVRLSFIYNGTSRGTWLAVQKLAPGSQSWWQGSLAVQCLVVPSCPTLCDRMDCSPPGSSVHEILQARILEWVAVPSSKGSCQPRDWTQVSCTAGRFFTKPPGKPYMCTARCQRPPLGLMQGLLSRLDNPQQVCVQTVGRSTEDVSIIWE